LTVYLHREGDATQIMGYVGILGLYLLHIRVMLK
jgi:hypothetical protein